MPWVFFAILAVYGLLSCVFAFVEPPPAISRIFKVPSIFVFLPDRYVMPVGRIFVGICCFVVVGVLYVKLAAVL